MKRLRYVFCGLVVFAGVVFANDFNTFTNELSRVLSDGSRAIATAMARNVGYYTGAGNVTPAHASGFPGLKFGLGMGVTMPGYIWQMLFTQTPSVDSLLGPMTSRNAVSMEAAARAFGMIPLAYNMVYGKIGLPMMPLDVGLRLGFIPNLEMGTDASRVRVGAFRVGVEGRYKLTGIDLVFAKSQIELRVSYDYDSGVLGASQRTTTPAWAGDTLIGTNNLMFALDNRWGGSSIGAKLVAGLSVLVFDVYGGVGANLNFGEVTTTSRADVGFTPNPATGLSAQNVTISGTGKAPYDMFDLRLLLGVHVVFFDLAVEWNPLNNALGITAVPISIAF